MEYISSLYSKIYNYFFEVTKNKVDENGLPHGNWETYYFNEKIQSKGVYNHGVKTGRWTYYDN